MRKWLRRLARRVKGRAPEGVPDIMDVDFDRWHSRAVLATADRRWDDALRAIEEARAIEAMVLEARAQVAPGTCPHCGERHTADTSVDGILTAPDDGDVSVCWRCGGVLLYEHGARRAPTDSEARELLGDPVVTALQNAVKEDRRFSPEQRRASLSYMFGWSDALNWSIANPAALREITCAVPTASNGIQRVCFLASEIYDELGADPERWVLDVPRDRILEIRP